MKKIFILQTLIIIILTIFLVNFINKNKLYQKNIENYESKLNDMISKDELENERNDEFINEIEEYEVNEILITLEYSQVIKLMGQPDKINMESNVGSQVHPDFYAYFLQYDGIEITMKSIGENSIEDSVVEIIKVTSNKYPTLRNVKVGDDINNLIFAYGKKIKFFPINRSKFKTVDKIKENDGFNFLDDYFYDGGKLYNSLYTNFDFNEYDMIAFIKTTHRGSLSELVPNAMIFLLDDFLIKEIAVIYSKGVEREP